MATVRNDLVGMTVGRPIRPEMGRSLTVLHAVEITADCPGCSPTDAALVLEYTRDERGLIVQVARYLQNGKRGNTFSNWLEDLRPGLEGRPTTAFFQELARQLGMNAETLAGIAWSHAPAIH